MDLTDVPNNQNTASHYTFTYENSVSVDQMAALIDSSKSCQQYLHMDCINVPMYNGDISISYWYDRNGISRGNWGTERNVKGCQCRVDGSKYNIVFRGVP